MKNELLRAASYVALGVLAGPAFAQTTEGTTALGNPQAEAERTVSNPAEAPRTYAADEIVITARKRAESVQDVPISVAAVSGTALQQQALNSFQSLTAVTSGFTVLRNANNVATFRIRGLGTGGGSDSFEQSVALFIDGSYAGRPAEYNQSLFDVQRVEIIKGTQAALLAKNTSLGAVSVTTRKPGDEFGFNGLASYEFNLGSHLIDLGVDVPLSDTLKVRFAGQANKQGGWVYNVALDEEGRRDNSLAGRMVAVWEPLPDLQVTALYQEYSNKSRGQSEEYARDPTGAARARAIAAGYPDFEVGIDRRLWSTSSFAQNGASNDDTTSGRRAILTANYDIGDYTLTSLTAYSAFDQRRDFDSDVLPGDFVSTRGLDNGNDQITQEIRLTSPATDRFNFIVGAFFLDEDWYINRETIATSTNGAYPTFIGTAKEEYDLNTKTLSGFGQANFDVTDWLRINGGIRVTNERKKVEAFRDATVTGTSLLAGLPLSINSYVDAPGAIDPRTGRPVIALYRSFPRGTRSLEATTVDGSVGAQVNLTSDHMIYASWSKGTKGGGFLSQPTTITTGIVYPREVAYTIEGGAKLTFGRSLFNVNLFRTRIKDLQQAVFVNPEFNTTPQQVRSTGVEVDAAYQFSDALRISGSVTYADAKFLAGTGTPAFVVGTRPLNAPKWTGNATVAYNQPIGNDLKFVADANVEFRSRTVWVGFNAAGVNQNECLGNNPTVSIVPCTPSFAKANLRLGIGREDDGWQLALVGRNIFDKTTIQYSRNPSLIPASSLSATDLPRTVALQFTINR